MEAKLNGLHLFVVMETPVQVESLKGRRDWFKFRSGTNSLNEELGRHRDKNNDWHVV